MKTIKMQRTIKPESGSKAKEKKGLIMQTRLKTETLADIGTLLRDENAYMSPTKRLNTIRTDMTAYLDSKGKPVRRDIVLLADGSWHYVHMPTDTYEQISKFCDYLRQNDGKHWNSLSSIAGDSGLVDPLSPEYFAMRAIEEVEFALLHLERNDNAEGLLTSSMMAMCYYQKFHFAEYWEIPALRGIAQQNSKPKKQKKEWATELAAYLVRTYPDDTFDTRWKNIPDEEVWAEYVVTVKDGLLWAVNERDNSLDSIKKESFRTKYIIKSKKI